MKQEVTVDRDILDTRLSAAAAGLPRRSLGLLPVLGVAGLGRGEETRAKKNKKRPRKCKMYRRAYCLNGNTFHVNSCGAARLRKRGATPGVCPEDCVPQCFDCTGATDGCGGICGCPAGQVCVDATCQDPQ